MFSILMTCLTDKPLILKWEVWVRSLLGLKGLTAAIADKNSSAIAAIAGKQFPIDRGDYCTFFFLVISAMVAIVWKPVFNAIKITHGWLIFLAIVFLSVVLCRSADAVLPDVGQCTFMEYYCSALNCNTQLVKDMQKDPTGDCRWVVMLTLCRHFSFWR